LAPDTGQAIQYNRSNSSSPAPTAGWQPSATFSGLIPATTYYIFARAAENANYLAGTGLVSAGGAIAVVQAETEIAANISITFPTPTNIQLSNSIVVNRTGPDVTVTLTPPFDSGTVWEVNGIPKTGTASTLILKGSDFTHLDVGHSNRLFVEGIINDVLYGATVTFEVR
jgi:hypothetical protein